MPASGIQSWEQHFKRMTAKLIREWGITLQVPEGFEPPPGMTAEGIQGLLDEIALKIAARLEAEADA